VLPLAPYALALAAFLLVRGQVLGSELEPPRPWVLYVKGRTWPSPTRGRSRSR
jgi:hypothetical protein